MKISLSICMHSKVILPILLVIFVIGITQFAFAEELKKIMFIAVDVEEFEQPKSTYNHKEITIMGYVEDYYRGEAITITVIYPDKTEKEINIFASKKGDIYTLFHVTQNLPIGTYMVFLEYDSKIAITSFEILEANYN